MLILIAICAAVWVDCARADNAAGMEAYKNKDYATALTQLRPEAQQGNHIAQNIVGVMYMNGLGMPSNDAEAAKWYRMAAEQGYAVAQTNLGFLYENGRGVAQSLAEARQWYQKAALQGDPRAGAFLKDLARKEEVQRQALSSKPVYPPPVSPAAVTATSQKMSDSDRAKATELAHLALPPLDQSGDALLVARVMTRTLDNPKRWNESSTDWGPIVEAIRIDVVAINRRFQSQRQEAQEQREKELATYYGTSIPTANLDELLAYYHSDEGRRYQAFMQAIQTVSMNAITDITGNALASGTGDLSDTSQLSAKEQSDFSRSAEDRLRALRLSRIYRIQLARGDAKLAMSAGNLIGAIAARYGEAVDRVGRNNRPDLSAFEKFSHSATAQMEIAGLVRIAKLTLPAEKQLKNEYLAELTSYRVKWRQLYTSRTKRTPGSPPAATT
jgi:hypothetical protein